MAFAFKALAGSLLATTASAGDFQGLSLLQLGAERHATQSDEFALKVNGPLPLNPRSLSVSNFGECKKAWHSAKAAPAIDAWKKLRPKAPVVFEGDDEACAISGAPSKAGMEILTIVENPEEEICAMKGDKHKRPLDELDFGSRKYLAIFPKDGVCTKENKCPVTVFFHGCGGFLPLEQFAIYDETCMENLGSVLLFPKIDRKAGDSWTGAGTEMLTTFVMPLFEQFVAEHGDILDMSRVTAAGESLGSGMALQAGLTRPDVFSAIIAMGITDGSTCDDVEHFHPEKLQIGTFDSANSKLGLIVATFAEKEANIEGRLSGILEVLDASGAAENVAVHFRIQAGANHVSGIHQAQDEWTSFHEWVWKGKTA